MLFSADDVLSYDKPANEFADFKSEAGAEQTILFKSTDTLKEKLPSIEKNIAYHFASGGVWSTHELLFHLLSIVGPANVFIATWSITEEPARMLVAGLNSGIINSMYGIFDVRVRRRSPETYAFAKHNFCQAKTSILHAKVTVIENENWKISIVGSSNYTNNPRIEAGVISTHDATAEFHKAWILEELKSANPFDL